MCCGIFVFIFRIVPHLQYLFIKWNALLENEMVARYGQSKGERERETVQSENQMIKIAHG